jgi:acetyl esterase/lipase
MPPLGPPSPGMSPKPFEIASATVKPSDLRTSSVITPNPKDQISCGKTELKIERDVVFSRPVMHNGATKPLAMDIQMPVGGGPGPLVVYITGGGFMFARKENALDLRTFVAESGFVVASVQYRAVLDSAGYGDSVADVKSAIRFLRAHAETYGIDVDRVAVWGESAGGYLAAMAGVTVGVSGFDIGDNLDQSSNVQAVVDKFGPSDLSKVAADFDAKS